MKLLFVLQLSSYFMLGYSANLTTCAGPITEKERIDTLAYHNDLRSTIALGNYVEGQNLSMPTGANIIKMEWSCELEQSAQTAADRCVFEHGDDVAFGENLFMANSDRPINREEIMLNAARVWENEFIKYGWSSLTLTHELFMTGIGHATQMAWANTRYLGCGSAVCNDGLAVHIVCHYSPRGNIVNQNIYEYGETCSDCPMYSTCESTTGLCSFPPSEQ